MKKIGLIVCLVLALALALTGCGSKSPNYNTEPGTLNEDVSQTEFTLMGAISALSPGYENNTVLNQLQEEAGIHINWNTMSDSSASR